MEGSGYTQIKKLGQGAFGAAWLCKRNKDGEKLVAKEVRLAGLKQAEKDSAKHEISMLRALKHPNITRYVDHFETRTSLFIVMEYANGGDLYTKIKSRRGSLMKESEVLSFFVQICLALGQMHSQHVLHRDLKTQNVFLTQDGVVKLGDFGISTVLRGTYDVKRTVCGTPYYFSPELCQNKAYNNKSDVWALGCILYELTTLNHAFEGSSMKALMARILKGVYPPIHHQYSKDLQALIGSMLQTDPAKRPSIHRILELHFVKNCMEKMRGDFGEANKDKRSLLDEGEKRKAIQEAQDRAVKAKQMQIDKEKNDKERKAQQEVDHQKRLAQIREKMAADMQAQEQRMRRHREENDAKEAAAAVKRKEWEARVKARAVEEKKMRDKMDAVSKQREAEWNANMEDMKKRREQQAQQVQKEDERHYEQRGGYGGGQQQPQAHVADGNAAMFREQRQQAAANRARALRAEEPPAPVQQQQRHATPPNERQGGGAGYGQQQQEEPQSAAKKKPMSDEERAAAQKEAYWEMRREAEANKRRLMNAGPMNGGGAVKRDSPPRQQQQQQERTPPPRVSPPPVQRAGPSAEALEAAKREAHIQMRREAEANKRRLVEANAPAPSIPQQQQPQQQQQQTPLKAPEQKVWEQQTPDAPRPPLAVMDDEELDDDDDVDGDLAMHEFLNNEAAGNGDGSDEDAAKAQANKHSESRVADYSAMEEALNAGLQGGAKDEDFGDEEEPAAAGGGGGLPGRFHLDGQTVQLPNVSAQDPLSYRIESLRLFLESALGDASFMKVYRLLDDVTNPEQGDVDPMDLAKQVLPRNHERYLTLVVQLIVCEDFYNCQQNQ